MKICLLSKMFPPVVGGSGAYAYEIADALGARGHDVDVFTQSKPGEETVDTHENVAVHAVARARRHLVTFETLYYSLRARFAADFDAYDVIHGTLMPASTIALSDRIGIDPPIVLTSHSFAPSEVVAHSAVKPADYLLKYAFHPTNVAMDTVAARAADRVIAISSEMERQLVERYRLPAETVTTVSHGVDTERFRPRDERHPAVSDDRLTLLFVGRLVTRKGADLAIDALAASDREDVELLVAGTGRLRSDLEARARDRGVEDRVTFLGYVPGDELPVLYSSADVTLFPSNYEGFGLVFLESMAAGTPVVGAPVGGIPDLVEDGQTGFVVDRTPSGFAARIDELAADRDRLERTSAAARDAVEHRDWDHVAGEVEAVYRNVLDN